MINLLKWYPTSPEAEKVRPRRDDLDCATAERQLYNRIDGVFHNAPDNKAEELAFGAIRAERDGDLDGARRRWKDLAALDQEAPRPLTLVAAQHLKELGQVEGREQELLQSLDLLRAGQAKPPSDADRPLVEALRYEKFGDVAAARSRWKKLKGTSNAPRPPVRPPAPALESRPDLKQDYEQKLDHWRGVLLAAFKSQQLEKKVPEDPEAARKKLLQDKLTEAKARLEANRREDARQLCQEIVDLYGGDAYPELADLVKKARDWLQ
jgi:hypothetical protein